RRGKTEHGTPLPLCAVFVLLASAARRLLGVAIALPRGSALSRESLTQDSRSTVKARLIDPLRESFGEGRCAPSRQKTWRPRERPSRGFRAFVMRRNPVDSAADRGMRAYVTGGWLRQLRRAPQHVHVRYDITPRRMASSWLATQAERVSCAACT